MTGKKYTRTCRRCEREFETPEHRSQYCPGCTDLRYRTSDAGILERDGHACRVCGARATDTRVQVHHVQSKIEERPEDKVTLCTWCHQAVHYACYVKKGRKNPVADPGFFLELIRKCNTRYKHPRGWKR